MAPSVEMFAATDNFLTKTFFYQFILKVIVK